ncbi:hypothetical protein [Maridesulfovibrio ferrireducens]|uniref:hypothetical protein n=1 Tax=Maridesulfovibrio ferrireducens TaxID=246191 RepID=UPI001A2FA034|nr:hypothetical protein [Maridesulfovibrio ferrireducens]MBI9113282.1 hypothetical protein [Maridesulfovibrio ferrireducens]
MPEIKDFGSVRIPVELLENKHRDHDGEIIEVCKKAGMPTIVTTKPNLEDSFKKGYTYRLLKDPDTYDLVITWRRESK